MERYKNYILSGISMVAGALFQYIYSLAEDKQLLLYVMSLIILLVCLGGLLFLQNQRRKKKVQYSALVFVLNKKKELLTVHNTYHNRLMIPCGILPRGMTPNEAVVHFLKEQTGLKRDDYCILDYKNKGTEYPSFGAQIEFITQHEKNVAEHYAFIYYVKIKDEAVNEQSLFRFMGKEELMNMDAEEGLFSDILQRYLALVEN